MEVNFLKLLYSVTIDAISALPTAIKVFSLPFFGWGATIAPIAETYIDAVWAPVSSILIYYMYKGSGGLTFSIINLGKEAFPGLDFIPVATIAWFYETFFNRGRRVGYSRGNNPVNFVEQCKSRYHNPEDVNKCIGAYKR